MSERADALRREADGIEKEERLQAAKESGLCCPDCGCQVFRIGAWTIVTQEWNAAEVGTDEEWGHYESGDHTDEWADATCVECHKDCTAVLEAAGQQFYDGPTLRAKKEGETT